MDADRQITRSEYDFYLMSIHNTKNDAKRLKQFHATVIRFLCTELEKFKYISRLAMQQISNLFEKDILLTITMESLEYYLHAMHSIKLPCIFTSTKNFIFSDIIKFTLEDKIKIYKDKTRLIPYAKAKVDIKNGALITCFPKDIIVISNDRHCVAGYGEAFRNKCYDMHINSDDITDEVILHNLHNNSMVRMHTIHGNTYYTFHAIKSKNVDTMYAGHIILHDTHDNNKRNNCVYEFDIITTTIFIYAKHDIKKGETLVMRAENSIQQDINEDIILTEQEMCNYMTYYVSAIKE